MPFGDFGLPALLAERQTGVLGAAVDFPGEARLLKYAATPSEPALVIPPKWYRHPFDAWLFYQAHRRAA
jgi:hypothetical protein